MVVSGWGFRGAGSGGGAGNAVVGDVGAGHGAGGGGGDGCTAARIEKHLCSGFTWPPLKFRSDPPGASDYGVWSPVD